MSQGRPTKSGSERDFNPTLHGEHCEYRIDGAMRFYQYNFLYPLGDAHLPAPPLRQGRSRLVDQGPSPLPHWQLDE
jgi:hypothetical protein